MGCHHSDSCGKVIVGCAFVSKRSARPWQNTCFIAGAQYTVMRVRISEWTFMNLAFLCAQHSLNYTAGRRSSPYSLVKGSKLKTQVSIK